VQSPTIESAEAAKHGDVVTVVDSTDAGAVNEIQTSRVSLIFVILFAILNMIEFPFESPIHH